MSVDIKMDAYQLLWVALISLSCLLYIRRRCDPLYAIPTVGYSAPGLSYISALYALNHAQEILEEGYSKYKGSVFRVPLLDRWAVIVCGAKMNEELRKLPDDQMSFLDAAEELVQTKYTVSADIAQNPIHIAVTRGPLTRNIAALTPDMVEEIHAAVNDIIPAEGDDWISVPGLSTMTHVVIRATNRIFVGLPLCRNKEYLDIIIDFQKGVAMGRFIIGFVPEFLKPIAGSLLPWSKSILKRFSAIVIPVIEQQYIQLREHGDGWSDKPNTYITWLMEEARSAGKSIDIIVQALLTSNFVAIHTSSINVTHALFHLAANPHYAISLREEIEAAIKPNGWSKQALGNMWKLDSFLRESQRMNGNSGISVIRKALVDVRLSDGTLIPAGTIVGAAAASAHYDEDSYENPHVFKPFRFSDMRGESERLKYQYVNTSPEYLPFGHGKHACPGRFFAANELKAILAILIVNYDMKLETRERPKNRWIGMSVSPDPVARVMFRKRKI